MRNFIYFRTQKFLRNIAEFRIRKWGPPQVRTYMSRYPHPHHMCEHTIFGMCEHTIFGLPHPHNFTKMRNYTEEKKTVLSNAKIRIRMSEPTCPEIRICKCEPPHYLCL